MAATWHCPGTGKPFLLGLNRKNQAWKSSETDAKIVVGGEPGRQLRALPPSAMALPLHCCSMALPGHRQTASSESKSKESGPQIIKIDAKVKSFRFRFFVSSAGGRGQ